MARNDIKIVGEDTKELFSIDISDDGSYFAIRNQEPLFCLQGTSIIDVATKAEQAFESWKRLTAKG